MRIIGNQPGPYVSLCATLGRFMIPTHLVPHHSCAKSHGTHLSLYHMDLPLPPHSWKEYYPLRYVTNCHASNGTASRTKTLHSTGPFLNTIATDIKNWTRNFGLSDSCCRVVRYHVLHTPHNTLFSRWMQRPERTAVILFCTRPVLYGVRMPCPCIELPPLCIISNGTGRYAIEFRCTY